MGQPDTSHKTARKKTFQWVLVTVLIVIILVMVVALVFGKARVCSFEDLGPCVIKGFFNGVL